MEAVFDGVHCNEVYFIQLADRPKLCTLVLGSESADRESLFQKTFALSACHDSGTYDQKRTDIHRSSACMTKARLSAARK